MLCQSNDEIEMTWFVRLQGEYAYMFRKNAVAKWDQANQSIVSWEMYSLEVLLRVLVSPLPGSAGPAGSVPIFIQGNWSIYFVVF
jgi:hypothetical protein